MAGKSITCCTGVYTCGAEPTIPSIGQHELEHLTVCLQNLHITRSPLKIGFRWPGLGAWLQMQTLRA